MFNIQKAVSRLDFAPPLKEIEVTDVKKGLAVFTPRPGKTASFAALSDALKKAGYTLASAEIRVTGTIARDAAGWWLVAEGSGQRFALRPGPGSALPAAVEEGARLDVSGRWTTSAEKGRDVEVIAVATATAAPSAAPSAVPSVEPRAAASAPPTRAVPPAALARTGPPAAGTAGVPAMAYALAPIRATSPGLTVYRGGAVSARATFTRQHLDGLAVTRRGGEVAVSYTPATRLQLAAEVPFGRTSFEDRDAPEASGSGGGFGNVTLWGKYRFFRTLETWGDRQASARLGLELPTGSTTSPSARALDRPDFVREQLSPIEGGLALKADLAYSQARGRLVFGGNVEGLARTERDGFRLGHEVRVNTDLELVAFPLRYDRPGGEVFAVLETSLVARGDGRSGGFEVPGSRSVEYSLAPGLQYVASPRLSVEASWLVPVYHDSAPLALRTDRSLLLGVRYLF